MNNFFDRFKPGGDKKKNDSKSNNSNNNPLGNLFGGGPKSFSGQGQSLGGSQPGQVIQIILEKPGPLGVRVEKRGTSGTAIVSEVIPDSQAADAGLKRGDICCFQGSNGQEEIMYNMFLELAKSNQRPLCFEVRRVPQTKHDHSTNKQSTADAYARKQAVIAAAEKREKAHKQKEKPLPKGNITNTTNKKLLSNAEKEKLEEERKRWVEEDKQKPISAATKEALEKVKQNEQLTANELGYNPYEVKNMNSGQARNAVTNTTHGTITDNTSNDEKATSYTTIPKVSAPSPMPAVATVVDPSPEFQQAFETTVTSTTDHTAVVNSIKTMRKLIINATTKGQDKNTNDASKFRKIRLSNPKIKTLITDIPGAIDLLLETGFQLHTENDENILLYPFDYNGPVWLQSALQQMDKYVQ